ncbi:F0F1 ATP synthase subunit A [Flavobacterium macrobrachii]|uniref:F0F1 ATP synthase subunit A n=1 Tax=Flavobacterium macrobrachii TaxID=591204 RepID=UPI003F6F8915
MVISKKPLHFIVATLVAFLPLITVANPTTDTTAVAHASVATETTAEHHEGESKELTKEELAEKERAEFIQHHLLDSHDFHLFSYGKESGHEKHVGFPLPVILWEDGLHFFMSSKFHHGEAVVESNGKYFAINHHDGMIYNTDSNGTFNVDEKHHTTNTKPIDFSITKNIVMILVVALLMLIIFRNLGKSYGKNGGIATGVGRFFEPLVLYIRDEIAIPNIGEKHYKKYMSHLLTVFFFIWFLNIFGLTPLGVNVTGNIAITAALAIITYIITTFTANKNYWGHIFWMPGVPAPMKIILAPIELLGTIIKPFSLMIRLYANMLAGHVVLMSIIALMYTFNSPIGSPLSFLLAFVLSILEILVALLQAYIFTMLTALYFGAANEEHHHDDAHH